MAHEWPGRNVKEVVVVMKPGYFCAAQLHMPPALVNYVSRYNLDEESITFTVTDAATGHTVTVEGLVVKLKRKHLGGPQALWSAMDVRSGDSIAIAIEPHKTVHWRAKVYRSPEHDSMPHWRAHRKEQSARRTAARTGSDGEEKHGPGRKRQRTTAQAPATGNMGGIAPDMSPFASPWLPLIQGLGSRWPNGAGGAMSAATVGAPGMGGAAPLPLPPLLPLPLLGSAGPQAFTAGLPGIAPMSWMPMPMPVAPSLLVTEAVPPAGAEGLGGVAAGVGAGVAGAVGVGEGLGGVTGVVGAAEGLGGVTGAEVGVAGAVGGVGGAMAGAEGQGGVAAEAGRVDAQGGADRAVAEVGAVGGEESGRGEDESGAVAMGSPALHGEGSWDVDEPSWMGSERGGGGGMRETVRSPTIRMITCGWCRWLWGG